MPTRNKVIINCTVHYIVYLLCTFSLWLIHMKVRDSDVLAWGQGHKKMSQVLSILGLLDFTMLRPFLAWRTFWNLWTVYFFTFPIFSGCSKPQLTLSPTQWSVRRLSLLGRLIHSHLWDGLSHRCLAFNSSFLSVDGITCLIYRFEAEEMIYRMVYHTYRLYRFLGYKSICTA
jgi:hypothetical protein